MKIIRHKPGRRPAYWPDAPVRQPVKRALLVGIQYRDEYDDEDNSNPLRGPHKDVFSMRQLLIVVLVDTDDPMQIQPTRDNLIRAIKNLVDGALPGDRFFFHCTTITFRFDRRHLRCPIDAGHAAQVQNSHFSEEDGMDECIVPSDGETRLIKDNELRRLLVDPLPIGSNLVVPIMEVADVGLDLEHLRCNQVYVPWISKGKRRSDSRMNANVRREAMVLSRHIYQNKRISEDNVVSRRTSVEQMISPPPDFKKINISPTRSMSIKSELEVWYDSPSSPIVRCTSPDSMWPCTGYCQPELPAEANVVGPKHSDGSDVVIEENQQIALSACKDDQLSWEDVDGSSMTTLIIEAELDPHPPLFDLLRDVSHKLHGFYLRLHGGARAHRKKIREVNKLRVAKGLRPRPIPADPPEMDNFQDPQLSSHRPVKLSSYIRMRVISSSGETVDFKRVVASLRLTPFIGGPAYYAALPASRKRALLVAISYPNLPEMYRLPNALTQAEALKLYLTTCCGYLENCITILSDNLDTPPDFQPTKENILRELKKFYDEQRPGDTFVFYCHGFQKESLDKKEEDGKDEYILPSVDNHSHPQIDEKDGIVDDVLRKYLICLIIVVTEYTTGQAFLGARHDGFEALKTCREFFCKTPDVLDDRKDQNLDNKGIKNNIVCISACKDSESVFEIEEVGSMTEFLIQFLSEPSVAVDVVHITQSDL
ncbi:hypothetical protein H0H92_007069 [Tricholoma furcatifolium]|nr:hypothetical protein H0H92_007069 [Tricholoma furcatifolium]